MGAGAMEQRFTFNNVAELYDRARAGYPQALYDDLIALADLKPGDPILEVGCGTGKATEEFERRGLRVVALDPGPDMIAAARGSSAQGPLRRGDLRGLAGRGRRLPARRRGAIVALGRA
jgi:ubiquinone/menaquinone biosynthesis C-methylase UbiE